MLIGCTETPGVLATLERRTGMDFLRERANLRQVFVTEVRHKKAMISSFASFVVILLQAGASTKLGLPSPVDAPPNLLRYC